MTCYDCAAASDLAWHGAPVVSVDLKVIFDVLNGHSRCRQREMLATQQLRAETGHPTINANTCTCQHRTVLRSPLTRQDI
jgi:hypothetical protein